MRVQSLRLGGKLGLAHGSTNIQVTLNEPITITTAQATGAALDLRVTSQPDGQTCTLSELAPTVIPPTTDPIFIRCIHTEVAHLVMPDTLPNDALKVDLGVRDIAYPGIPYESRPGVTGGIFPYEYRLTGLTLNGVPQSTAGVSLDFRRGTLRFTPASEGTYIVSIQIKDSGSAQKTLNQNFTIQASATNFLFVAPDGIDGAGRGSKASPLKTLAFALSQSTSNKVIFFRKGTYVTGGFAINDTKAKQFLAYPDEVATLDLNGGTIGVGSNSAPAPRFEGMDITGVKQYGIASDPSSAGLVIRNVRFVNGIEGDTPRENPAFIHGRGDSARTSRHQLLVQENDFGSYTMKSDGAYALTLFDAGHSIIENNQMRLGAVNGAINDKDNSQYNTIRENYIYFSASKSTGTGVNVMAQDNAEHEHIHHNLLINAGLQLGIQCFQSSCYTRDMDIHHNTFQNNGISMYWGPFNSTSSGIRVSNNIINSGALAPYWGMSCTARPTTLTVNILYKANMLETSSSLAHKDSECNGNNIPWSEWQGTYGFDTTASGSTVTTTSALTGSGPTLGLPSGDTRRTQRGHQY